MQHRLSVNKSCTATSLLCCMQLAFKALFTMRGSFKGVNARLTILSASLFSFANAAAAHIIAPSLIRYRYTAS